MATGEWRLHGGHGVARLATAPWRVRGRSERYSVLEPVRSRTEQETLRVYNPLYAFSRFTANMPY